MEALAQDEEWQGLEALRDPLRSILARKGVDENDADDVIQETYIRAARYRAGLAKGGSLKSWATRIAMNVLSDWKRRSRRVVLTPPGEGVLENEAVDDGACETGPLYCLESFEVEKESALRLIAESMDTLRERDQRLLGSFYCGAQSSRETALECDIPPHLVKVRLFRARRRLVRLMRRQLALRPVPRSERSPS